MIHVPGKEVNMSTEELKKEAAPAAEPKPKKKRAPKKKVETEEKPKLLRGIVSDCARLNVRSLGVMTSGVVAILNRGDSVLIDPEKSTDGWYSVKTKNGKIGFCMKKFIKVP